MIFILIPIIAIVGGLAALSFLNKSQKSRTTSTKSPNTKLSKSNNITPEQITAQEFINLKDITDRYLYTRDGLVFMYIRIYPISPDLLSKREKKTFTRQLTAELSAETLQFGFMALSRPVDISPLVKEYSDLLVESNDPVQKEILKNEMQAISNYALSGEVVERQFYIKIWETYKEGVETDLLKRCFSLLAHFTSSGVNGEILAEDEIIKLCNLVTNPAYVHFEDTNVHTSMPIIESLVAASKEE